MPLILSNNIYTPEEAFNKFLNESNITYLGHGGSGIILKIQFIGNKNETPYYAFNSQNISSPVTEIALKLVLLNDLILPNKSNIKIFDWGYDRLKLSQDNTDGFIREINNQCNIVLKTLDYIEPISPTIVFSDILSETPDIEFFIKILSNKSKDYEIYKLINGLVNILNKVDYYNDVKSRSNIGIIAMELVTSNFKP